MARVLIVGCGCRGRVLASGLAADGYAVRGTSRSETGRAAIEEAGAEGLVADPDRLGTILPALEGTAVVCWLMGTASGRPEGVAAVNGPRLESMLEQLVDTPVRGLVYEAGGTAPAALAAEGAALVRRAGERHRMPVAIVDEHPEDHREWLASMRAAVAGLLSA